LEVAKEAIRNVWREAGNRADFMERVQDSCSNLIAERFGVAQDKRSKENLRSLAEILGDESTKFLFAPNFSLGLRHETFVQNVVVNPATLVWSHGIIMDDPGSHDIVSLTGTKANDVVETFLFKSADPVFHVGVRLGSLERRADASHIFIFPKHLEHRGEFSVSIVDQEFRFDANVFSP